MNFILQEMKIDLGDTPIENIFITDYMPTADGTYVKVYLLGYKYAKDKQNKFNNETIAKNLKIPLSDVLGAWTYWENEGVIIKHKNNDEYDEYNYLVEFINLKQLYIDKVYKYITKSSEGEKSDKNNYVQPDELISSSRNEENMKMMEEIEKMIGMPLKIREKQKIISWINQYKMKPEIMTQAFSYCINNKKVKNFKYIESVVAAWCDEGVCDIDTMMSYLEKRNDRFSIYSRISKALGFNNRTWTEAEIKTIDKWMDDWKFTIEMILRCLENSTKISNPNLNYFDKILEEWYKKGYKNLEDLHKDKKEKSENQKPIKYKAKEDSKPKNKFHNFEQKIKNYSEEELEQMVRKRFEKKLDNLGLSMPDKGDK